MPSKNRCCTGPRDLDLLTVTSHFWSSIWASLRSTLLRTRSLLTSVSKFEWYAINLAASRPRYRTLIGHDTRQRRSVFRFV